MNTSLSPKEKNWIIGITGASGPGITAIILEYLATIPEIKTHLVATATAKIAIGLESPCPSWKKLKSYADYTYDNQDLSALIASGSFLTEGMIVCPASMKTCGALAHGLGDNLLTRAADVTLKENRRLIVCPRETPLHQIHLQNLLTLSQAGAIICPPMITTYHKPQSVHEILAHTAGKILDLCGIENQLFPRWKHEQQS